MSGAAQRAGALLLLTSVSLAVALGLAELGVRMAGFQALYQVYSKPSLFWRHDPVLGWSHEPGAEGVYVGPRPWPIEYRTPVRINSQGLRGPEIEALAPGETRVLLLGDSTVAGFEVAYEDTFGELLEERLEQRFGSPFQVINAGVRGYGTDQSALYFREHGVGLAPDLVVFVHAFNDPENNVTLHRMRRPFGKAAFGIEKDGGLGLRGHPIPRYPLCSAVWLDAAYEPVRLDGPRARAFCWVQVNLADHSALFSWVTLTLRRYPDLLRRIYGLGSPGEEGVDGRRRDAAVPGTRRAGAGAVVEALRLAGAGPGGAGDRGLAPRFELTSAILLELGRSVAASGADFALVVPRSHWERLDGERLEAAGITGHLADVPGAPGMSRYLHFANDPHLNETGHDLLARRVAEITVPILERRLAGTAGRGPAPDPPLNP